MSSKSLLWTPVIYSNGKTAVLLGISTNYSITFICEIQSGTCLSSRHSWFLPNIYCPLPKRILSLLRCPLHVPSGDPAHSGHQNTAWPPCSGPGEWGHDLYCLNQTGTALYPRLDLHSIASAVHKQGSRKHVALTTNNHTATQKGTLECRWWEDTEDPGSLMTLWVTDLTFGNLL